jgi:hypothetical protein
MRNTIKDDQLATEVENIETQNSDPRQSRELIFSIIRMRYTLPA